MSLEFSTLDDQIEVYGDNAYCYDDDGYLIEKVTPTGTTCFMLATLGALMMGREDHDSG